jgi:hypothetical protein
VPEAEPPEPEPEPDAAPEPELPEAEPPEPDPEPDPPEDGDPVGGLDGVTPSADWDDYSAPV